MRKLLFSIERDSRERNKNVNESETFFTCNINIKFSSFVNNNTLLGLAFIVIQDWKSKIIESAFDKNFFSILQNSNFQLTLVSLFLIKNDELTCKVNFRFFSSSSCFLDSFQHFHQPENNETNQWNLVLACFGRNKKKKKINITR